MLINKSRKGYKSSGFYDELLTPAGNARTAARNIINMLRGHSVEEVAERRMAAALVSPHQA